MTPLTATALCLRCQWAHPDAPMDDTDKAAEKHTKVGHPTMTIIIRRPAP